MVPQAGQPREGEEPRFRIYARSKPPSLGKMALIQLAAAHLNLCLLNSMCRSKKLHRGVWHLLQGKGTNILLPHGGSSSLPTCAQYSARLLVCLFQQKLRLRP